MNAPHALPEELLMAYADGELSAPEHAADRARVEAAMRADPQVASRVEKHRALRAKLSASFDRVLDESVPDRLVAAVRASRADGSTPSPASRPLPDVAHAESAPMSTPSVTDLNRARAERAAAAASKPRGNWGWPQWGAIAASLVIGAVIGHQALQSPPELIGTHDGRLVAQAGLAEALSNQLASTQSENSAVLIGTSYKTKSGEYCRTFTLQQEEALGGIACRSGNTWTVNTLARTSDTSTAGYRQAGTEMPAAVRSAVEEQIVGDPLDSSAEAQAKASGWK